MSLDFRLAEKNVRVTAPEGVLSILEATLSFVPRPAPTHAADVSILVQLRDDVWEIYGHGGSIKVLGAGSALPQVAGAVVSSAVFDVAVNARLMPVRATVMELRGRALAFLGDDWESAITIAAHLHGRGWRYVGTDNVLVDVATLEVIPIQKSLYVNSSSVALLPIEYRRAVEASPWYVTSQGIAFYAVDPRYAGYAETWAASTRLSGVVVVDGAMNDRSALESLDERSLKSERFSRFNIDWRKVPVVDLQIGGLVESCDLIEYWFGMNRS